MSENIIPLANRRALRKTQNEHSKNQATEQRPTPVAAQAYVIGPRRCLVCQHSTGTTTDRYCEKHRGAYWRWLECSEPGCGVVGERKIPGQTIFRCPAHRLMEKVPVPPVGAPDKPGIGRGKEQVKALLAARRAALAKERTKTPLPPRPPYNIGHYADPRNRTQ